MLRGGGRRLIGTHAMKGYCLPELIVSVGIGLVVIAMAFHVVGDLEGRFRGQHRGMAMEQDARLGLAVFAQEVMSAATDSVDGTVLRRAEPSVLEFRANVNGLETVLTEAALAGQGELIVQDGSEWQGGKLVRLCAQGRCYESRLAKDGQRLRLSLATPLAETLPAGTEVAVMNQVRYYVLPGTRGTFKLMRQIDGGANTLIGDLHTVDFDYRDAYGRSTLDVRRMKIVRLSVSVGSERRRITQEVGLRL
ncbi:hypothetical protein YTPLAS18_34630 [Nitrospira sp.]|nr:hypothetical protein YTPLAS18_34630 [Nitrospira sp.]